MQIIHEPDVEKRIIRQATIALGTFDGLHLGHQSIIKAAVQLAKETNGPAMVFTFSSHPAQTLDPLHCPPMLLSQRDKIALLSDWGVDVLCQVPFSETFSQLSPEAFINFLQERFSPTTIVVGRNYTYGRCGAGNQVTLQQAGQERHFRVVVKDLVVKDGKPASSTAIRELLKEGAVAQAARLLGRNYHLAGVVVNGDGRGRKLGFPTANLEVEEPLLLPGDGVYAVYMMVHGCRVLGMASIGSNPTFGDGPRRLEIHLFNWRDDLYNCQVSVQFAARLRDMIHFPSAEMLVAQLEKDRLAAKKALLS